MDRPVGAGTAATRHRRRHSLRSLFWRAISAWSQHEGPRLSAALAFYATLSLAPLVLIVVSIVALAFGQTAAHGQIVAQAQSLLGPDGARTVETVLRNAQQPASGILSSIVSLLVVLFGASGVFAELRSALNKLWEVEPRSANGILGLVKERIFSFGMVLAIGFLLLVSLLMSAAVAALGAYYAELLPLSEFVLSVINSAASFATVVFLFALIFRYVPDRRIPWRRVWLGAVATAFLFTIGKQLIGLYLGKAAIGSAYGAAGSLVVLIVWVYYSSMSFYLGAELTRVLNPRHSLQEEPG